MSNPLPYATEGYAAVVNATGEIQVRTVSPTPIAAMVNALAVSGHFVAQGTPMAEIESQFDEKCRNLSIRKVNITLGEGASVQ